MTARVPRQLSAMSMALGDRAADNLRFIRDTMARAGAFTSVSGTGMISAGALGLVASAIAPPLLLATDPRRFLAVWIGTACVAGAVSWLAIRRKAGRSGQSLIDGPARRFALAFAPALVAGAVLTVAIAAAGHASLLPGTWLSLYGAAVTAAGAFSVKPVPIMGMAFLALGALCFALPAREQQYVLAAGFGVLHLSFGYQIMRHYGG